MELHNTAKDPVETKLVAAMPGGIEAQEAAGQREMVESTTVPRERRGDDAEYEALGFAFGAPVPGDDLFQEATLPEGWSREGSDHSMWSYIVDGEGFRRVAIFYKAAFYDRCADMHIERLPRTRAQSEAWERASKLVSGTKEYDRTWRQGDMRREGDNVVYVFIGQSADEFDHDAGHFKLDGRYAEVVVAKDGTVVEQRDSLPS